MPERGAGAVIDIGAATMLTDETGAFVEEVALNMDPDARAAD